MGKSKKKSSPVSFVIAFCFTGFILTFACCLGIGNRSTNEPVESRPSQNQSSADALPGILPVDVYGNYTKLGFSKTGPEFLDDGFGGETAFWKCVETTTDAERYVEIYGDVEFVDTVRGTYLPKSAAGISNREAADFLGYVATIPYDGASQEDARNFVKRHISEDASIIIGKVKLEIFGSNPAKTLRISPIK